MDISQDYRKEPEDFKKEIIRKVPEAKDYIDLITFIPPPKNECYFYLYLGKVPDEIAAKIKAELGV